MNINDISYRKELAIFCELYCLNDPIKVALAESAFYACHKAIMSQLAAPAYRPVGTVRHFIYEGIAKNGHTIEPSLFDGVDLPDGTTLYAAPQGEGK